MTAVHQFVPSYVGRSAIATHARQVTAVLRSMGLDTRTYVGDSRDVDTRDVRPYETYRRRAGEPTWLLYQLSIGHPMGSFLAAAAEPLLIQYHNITPETYFGPWEPLVVPQLRLGRQQLRELVPRTRLALAVSRYNRGELIEAGYPCTATVPLLVDFDELGEAMDPATVAALEAAKSQGGSDWLFVGRIAPNKGQHLLVRALAVYRRLYDPRARLWLVGGSSSHFYETTLHRYITALGLDDAVHVTGSVSQAQLVAHYRGADVFVSLSEHEGFCLPLIEAMWHRLPVVALGSSAVPETVAGAGLVLPLCGGGQPAGATIAAAVHRVLSDRAWRDRLVDLGTARAGQFALSRTVAQFSEAIASVVDGERGEPGERGGPVSGVDG